MSEPTEANAAAEAAPADGTAEPAGGAGRRHVRVVLVDDHRMFRTGVQAEIGQTEQTGVEVVGEAADVDQAVTVITATRPEVVLLDVHLPGGGGIEVLRRCTSLMGDPERPVRFLALSVSDAAEDVIGVIRAGARGYVTKTITGADLVDSIFRVQDGLPAFILGSVGGRVLAVDAVNLLGPCEVVCRDIPFPDAHFSDPLGEAKALSENAQGGLVVFGWR